MYSKDQLTEMRWYLGKTTWRFKSEQQRSNMPALAVLGAINRSYLGGLSSFVDFRYADGSRFASSESN